MEGLISEGHTLLQRSAGALLETLITVEILILLRRLDRSINKHTGIVQTLPLDLKKALADFDHR